MAPVRMPPRRPQSNLGSLQVQNTQADLVQKSKSGLIQYPVRGMMNNNLYLDSGKKLQNCEITKDLNFFFHILDPIFITCPACFDLITTKVIYETNKETKTSCCSRFLNSNLSKDALHYCPNDDCHAFLGKYSPH
jgi:hypothetical protein